MRRLRLHASMSVMAWFARLSFGQFGGIDPLVPNDPLFFASTLSPYGQHWLHATKVTFAWTLVGYDEPWTVDHGNANRTIAIIDSELDPEHPEFGEGGGELFKIHPDSRSFFDGGLSYGGPPTMCNCVPANFSDGTFLDEFGVTHSEVIDDTLWRYPALGGQINPHGTVLAGISAATAQNEEGIAGVCWDCSILVLRISAIVESNEMGCN